MFYRKGFLAPCLTTWWTGFYKSFPSPVSPYLCPPEAAWPSYTPRQWVPILVAFYDTHGVRWGYSNSRPPYGKVLTFRDMNYDECVIHNKYEPCDWGPPSIIVSRFVTCFTTRHQPVRFRKTGHNAYVLECYVMQNTFKHASALVDQREACFIWSKERLCTLEQPHCVASSVSWLCLSVCVSVCLCVRLDAWQLAVCSVCPYFLLRKKCLYIRRDIFFLWFDSPIWAWASSFRRGFTITLRHTTLGRTPLDEWSARHRDLYLTTHNTHNRQTSTPPAGFKPAIPVSERLQTHALDKHGHWDRPTKQLTM
jgi:hypothetical protein